MKTILLTISAAASLIAAPLMAHDRIGTLQKGRYECGMPGDATGPAWIVDAELGFWIVGASSYESSQGRGTYLRSGDSVTFTRGPFKGVRLQRLGSGLLQEVLPGGNLGRMRCHRVGRNAGQGQDGSYLLVSNG